MSWFQKVTGCLNFPVRTVITELCREARRILKTLSGVSGPTNPNPTGKRKTEQDETAADGGRGGILPVKRWNRCNYFNTRASTSYYHWPFMYYSSICSAQQIWRIDCVCVCMCVLVCVASCWVWIGVDCFINGSVVFLPHQPFRAHSGCIDSAQNTH